MNIQEAIEHSRDVAKCKIHIIFLHLQNITMNVKKCADEHEQLAEWLEELKEYKQLGTLEEVQEAVEKHKAKKPLFGGNTDKLTGDIHICPCCCGIVGMDDMRADYCADCGQAIDWSEENVR